MGILIFHLVTLATVGGYINSYDFLVVSEQIWTSSALAYPGASSHEIRHASDLYYILVIYNSTWRYIEV